MIACFPGFEVLAGDGLLWVVVFSVFWAGI